LTLKTLPGLVLDPGIVADRQQLLANLVAAGAPVAPEGVALRLASLSPFLPASTQHFRPPCCVAATDAG
jgi:hypothetical protein